jgi:hypothetical protein
MADVVPGGFDVAAVSPLYVDGMPVDALVKALAKSQDILSAQKQAAESSFWSTPRRVATDSTREVFEVNLNAPRMVNKIAFDLARFPHTAFLYYRDTKTKAWKPLKAPSGALCRVSIEDSLPAKILPLPPGSTSHPQHYGAGHWVHFEETTRPVTASQFRLVLVRHFTGRIPVNAVGRVTPYSLGVRGFNIGYKVRNLKEAPRTPRDPIIVAERESFTSTTDILGSPVTLSIRENRASDLLRGSVWKCEPQPIPEAVVSLYVDARDDQGNPQVIDRFYVDPLNSGVHMNLYYSNDTPSQTTFEASDHPLTFPASKAVGASTGVTPAGLVFPDAIGYVEIDNAAVQFNPDRPFWLGLSLQPNFDSTDTNRHIFLDTGIVRVEWTGTGLQAMVGAAALSDLDTTFTAGEVVNLVVGWDGKQAILYSGGNQGTFDLLGSTPKSSVLGWSILPGFRLGGLIVPADGDPGHGNFRLQALVLKSEVPPGIDSYEDFFTDPQAYLVKSDFPEDDTHTTDNALLRYLPSFQTYTSGSINPLGFLGGPSDRYAELIWTPISRDFKLNKGYLVFPPTKAKYFKFEFTNLAAMPYDNFHPTTRTVKVFPTAVQHRSTLSKSSASNNTAGGGVPAAMAANATLFFADQSRLYLNQAPTARTSAYLATEAAYSNNPAIQASLRSNSIYFSLQPWHQSKQTPRFVEVQKHIYDTVEVQHDTRVAYFVGLSSLSMMRVDYLVDDDADQYVETFDDARHINADTSGWNLVDGFMETPDSLQPTETISTQSQVFSSRRKVTGLQFATQQTPPIQLIDDPDFDDQGLTYWKAYGDGTVTPSDDFTTDIGTLVKVERDSTANFWGNLEQRFPTWGDIEDAELTWGDLEVSESSSPFGGIEASLSYQASPEGRLYAAARVYAPKALTAPLLLQLVSDEGDVLSSEPIEVPAGQVTEWYSSYTIGESGDVTVTTWGQIEQQGLTWADVEALGSWGQIGSTSGTFTGKVSVRLYQDTPTNDAWYVDNLSIFDDPITWQFSNDSGDTWYSVYDIRNDPNGVFVFPPSPSTQAGTGLMWRCVGSYAKIRVSDLAIRPWYDSLPMGQPHRETIQSSGPNQALIDHYAPIEEDPRWKAWHKPIPESWWFTFRQWLLAERPEVEAKSYIVAPDTIVPVDEGLPPVVWHQENAVALFSGTNRTADPADQTDYYPYGPVATCVLEDGTIFVAVTLLSNVNVHDPGFIRMWHLAEDLTVLGTTDHHYEDVIVDNGLPMPFALAADGNKVVLLIDTAYDDDGVIPTGGVEGFFDTGSGYATDQTATRSLIMGIPNTTGPTDTRHYILNEYGTTKNRVSISADDTTTKGLAGRIYLGQPESPSDVERSIPSLATIRNITINAFVNVPAETTTIGWKLVDKRQPYGQVLASGTSGLNRPPYWFPGGSYDFPLGWQMMNTATYTPASEAVAQPIVDAYNAHALLLVLDLGASGLRECSFVAAYPLIGRKASA